VTTDEVEGRHPETRGQELRCFPVIKSLGTEYSEVQLFNCSSLSSTGTFKLDLNCIYLTEQQVPNYRVVQQGAGEGQHGAV